MSSISATPTGILINGALFVPGSAVWGEISGTLSDQTDLQAALNLKAPIASPTFTGTVSGVSAAMVGLGNVDNTSDANKPVSTATQTALNLKANLASPTFTGTVSGITAAMVGAPSGSGTSSGTNTGDNATNSQYSGLAASKQDVLVSAINIKTINGVSVLGSGNLVVAAGDPSYSPGPFTVATETSKILGDTLNITGTDEVEVQGTGSLLVIG